MNLLILFIIMHIGLPVGMYPSGIQYFPKALQRELSGKAKAEAHMLTPLEIQTEGQGSFFVQNLQPGTPYVYVGRVVSCRAGGCSAAGAAFQANAPEYFDYFMLFNDQGEVLKLKVFNYRATHGHEITVAGWLKQFIGYNGREDLVVGKHIDSISGATISVNSLTSDVENKTRLLQAFLNNAGPQTAIVK